MTEPKIGLTFVEECRAAGISMDGWAWSMMDGQLFFNEDVPQETRDKIAAVLAAHDPTKKPEQPKAD